MQVLFRSGYGGATTDIIAKEAGVSRGAIIHHFGTRAQLMADVIGEVYEEEHREYQRLEAEGYSGQRLADWPEMLWKVLRKPSGLAVQEILQASRSDPSLAALVAPVYSRIDQIAAAGLRERFPDADESDRLVALRLFVWAIRGLSVAQVLAPDPAEVELSVKLFRRIVEAGETNGAFRRDPATRNGPTAA